MALKKTLKKTVFPENTRTRLFAKILYHAISNPKQSLGQLNMENIKKLLKNLRENEPGAVESKLFSRIHSQLLIKKTPPYERYLINTALTGESLSWMKKAGENFLSRPSIRIAVMPEGKNTSGLGGTIESIASQSYENRHLSVLAHTDTASDPPDKGDFKILNHDEFKNAFTNLKEDFAAFLSYGSRLSPDALFEAVKFLNINPDADFIYSDEDSIVDGKRGMHFFKPDWSPDLLLSMNYINGFFLIRKDLCNSVVSSINWKAGALSYDLILRATGEAKNIGHIQKALVTKTHEDISTDARAALEDALKRQNIAADVIKEANDIYRVKRVLSGAPLVSIIIPTAYKKPHELKACLASIKEKTSYWNYEILIVDNSRGAFSLREIAEIFPDASNIVHIIYDRPFNYSEANNLGASRARGDFFVFLNDDTEVISPAWLEAMLEHAQRPEVGVVGAKLCYQDMGLQHGGVFLVDSGGAGRHAFRGQRDNTYHNLSEAVRNCSAVTFACVMARRDVFKQLNGLDEGLKVECNDVDFCLRARALGYLVVWTPYAALFHKELATRGNTNHAEDVSFHWARWGHIFRRGDPYYNDNLNLDADDFSVSERPVIAAHYGPEPLPEGNVPQEKRFLKRADIDPSGIKKILIVKLDHIGDVILGLPAIARLRKKFPSARITVLSGPWAREILLMTPGIDEVVSIEFFNERSEKGLNDLSEKDKETIRKLGSAGFDLAIDLRRHPETRGLLKLSGARHTVGYSTGKDDSWMSICMNSLPGMENTPSQPIKPHITAQLCALVDNIPGEQDSTQWPIETPALRFEPAKEAFTGFSGLAGNGPIIGIHPGTGSAVRQWPIEHFARLADLFIEKNNARLLIFAGASETGLAQNMLGLMRHKDRAESLAGRLDMKGFMSALKKCGLFVGNISGPSHIAGLVGTPALSVFGGQVTPLEWSPLGRHVMSVRMAIDCAPCYKSLPEHCPHALKCLKMLWPEKVFSAAIEVMAISGGMTMIGNENKAWLKPSEAHSCT